MTFSLTFYKIDMPTRSLAEEAQRVYTSLRDLLQRSTGLVAPFASAWTGNRAWLSGAIVLLLLALVLSWPWILEQIETRSDICGHSSKAECLTSAHHNAIYQPPHLLTMQPN